MRFYLTDIETIPLPEGELIKMMPPHLANPVMPDGIKSPVMPEELVREIGEFITPTDAELMDGCPAYKTAKFPDGDPEKKKAYHDKALQAARNRWDAAIVKQKEKRSEWLESSEEKRMAWEEKQIENKQKFIDDAALSATTGMVKLIGVRDFVAKKTYIFIAEATAEEMAALNAATYPSKVLFLPWAEEKAMLGAFAHGINAGNVIPANDDYESDYKMVTFYGNGFDFPFVFRRAWITGAPAPHALRKGRYWNDSVSVDLLDVWQLGDRQEKVGGMDGLAKVLGTKRKSGTGEGFHRLWTESPVAAVLYLLDDLDVLEEAAERMGIIYTPKATTLPAKGK